MCTRIRTERYSNCTLYKEYSILIVWCMCMMSVTFDPNLVSAKTLETYNTRAKLITVFEQTRVRVLLAYSVDTCFNYFLAI